MHFVELLEELAPVLTALPPDVSQDVVGALTGIARLLDNLDVARLELERKLALIEAEEIVRGGGNILPCDE